MKRILALLTAVCLVMTVFAACGKNIDDTPATDAPDSVDTPAVTDGGDTQGNEPAGDGWNGYDIGFVAENGIKYIWDQLDDTLKANVATVMNAIDNVELSCVLPTGVPSEESKDFCNFIYNMCMDYTYVGTSFNFKDADQDGLLETLVIPYNFEVIQTQEDAEKTKTDLEAALSAIVGSMPDGSDYEKIKYLHDSLVFSTTYGEICLLPFTAYGALVEHMATCQGYADAMHLLLDRAGYETVFAVGHGSSDQVTHKWNYVHLSDGNWYAIDPTWADPEGKNDDRYINYDYFLISDEVLLQDHIEKFESRYYSTPTATSMDMCYHVQEGYYVTSYDEAYACVEEQVRKCAENGTKYVYLRISDEDLYTEIHHRLLVTEYGGEISDIIKRVVEETGADFSGRWSTYRAHKDGKGPLCIMVTLRTSADEAAPAEDEE